MAVDRRTLLKGAAATLSLGPGQAQAEEDRRPNVIVIVADDMGYADLGVQGNGDTLTPSLDALAEQSLRLTDFYASSPVCSPSRAAMLTGRRPSRAGFYHFIPEGKGFQYLRERELTYPEHFRANGYQTVHLGKWHLHPDLTAPNGTPADHGFDHWYGTPNNALPSHKDPVNFLADGYERGRVKGFACQIVVDDALAWMDHLRDQERPFLLNLWFHEPHTKYGAPEEFLMRHEGDEDQGYLACVEHLDAAVGRLLSALDERELAEDTIVVFTSDNGSPRRRSNLPFQGRKFQLLEGGIRVPALVRWPGHVFAGTVDGTATCGMDLFPTLVSLAGLPVPDVDFDGVDFSPLLAGERLEREPLYWFYYRSMPAMCLRERNLVLVGWLAPPPPKDKHFRREHLEYIRTAEPKRFALYDLLTDPGQEVDLSDVLPAERIRMEVLLVSEYQRMLEQMVGYDLVADGAELPDAESP